MNYKLILGSRSPRRKQLLSDLGFNFETRTRDTDESFPDDLAPEQVAVFIAQKKAEALFRTLGQDELLICADTVVVCDNEVMGKPTDDSDAFKMLRMLSGNVHQVFSGVTLACHEKVHSFSVCTDVHFRELTDHEIRRYIDEFQPFDKAGSYGIQEWIGHIGVTRIEGSYENVVGLPTERLYSELKNFGVEIS